MEGFYKLANWIIALVVLILFLVFYYNPGGSFEKIKDSLSGIIKFADQNIGIGAEEIKAEKTVLSKEREEAVKKLSETIRKMSGSNCFANYKSGPGSNNGRNGLPELGKEGVSLVFEKTGEGMALVIKGGIAGKQEIKRELFSGVQPCVISGKTGEDIHPLIFEENILRTNLLVDPADLLEEELFPPSISVSGKHYLAVDKIEIKYDLSGFNENRIAYTLEGQISDFLDFEDGGYLYKTGNLVCFFPTNDAGTNVLGLNDDLLGGATSQELGTVPYLFFGGQKCS